MGALRADVVFSFSFSRFGGIQIRSPKVGFRVALGILRSGFREESLRHRGWGGRMAIHSLAFGFCCRGPLGFRV